MAQIISKNNKTQIDVSSEYNNFYNTILGSKTAGLTYDTWPRFFSLPPLIVSIKTDIPQQNGRDFRFKYDKLMEDNESADEDITVNYITKGTGITFAIKLKNNNIYDIMSREVISTSSISNVFCNYAYMDKHASYDYDGQISNINTIESYTIPLTKDGNYWIVKIPGTNRNYIIWNIIAVDNFGRVTTCCAPWIVNEIGTLINYGSSYGPEQWWKEIKIKYSVTNKNIGTEDNPQLKTYLKTEFLNLLSDMLYNHPQYNLFEDIWIGQSSDLIDDVHRQTIQIRHNLREKDYNNENDHNAEYNKFIGVNTLQSIATISTTALQRDMGMSRALTSNIGNFKNYRTAFTTAQINIDKIPFTDNLPTIHAMEQGAVSLNDNYKKMFAKYYYGNPDASFSATTNHIKEYDTNTNTSSNDDSGKRGSKLNFGSKRILIREEFWKNRTPWAIDNPVIINMGAGKTYSPDVGIVAYFTNYCAEVYRVMPPIAVYPMYFMVRCV